MNGIASPSPLRVLVVDDCQDTTASLSWLLRMWGHDVRAAHDGPAALEAARAFRPHVVLLDMALQSRWDGCDVGRRLRALPGLEQVSMICLSGYAMDADRRRSQLAGFNHHFAKPADPTIIQRLLASEQASLADVESRVPALKSTLLALIPPDRLLPGPPIRPLQRRLGVFKGDCKDRTSLRNQLGDRLSRPSPDSSR